MHGAEREQKSSEREKKKARRERLAIKVDFSQKEIIFHPDLDCANVIFISKCSVKTARLIMSYICRSDELINHNFSM